MNYSVKDGLSQNTVTCIFRDRSGFLWVGTQDGLNQFDGSRFIRYKHEKEDSTSISDQYVTAIQEDGSGNLLIGTRNGLNLFNRSMLNFLRIYPDSAQKSNIQYAFERIEKTSSGDLIISGLQFLYHWDHTNKAIKLLDNDDIITMKNFAVYRDTYYQMGIDGKPVSYKKPYTYSTGKSVDLQYREKTSVYIDRRGKLWSCRWVGDQQTAIGIYDIPSGRWVNTFTVEQHINHISFDHDNMAWISTMNGILQMQDGGQPKVFKVDGHPLNSQVLFTITDEEGLTWIGYAYSGLGMYNPMMKAFSLTRTLGRNEPVLASLNVSEKEFLLGTGAGLYLSGPKGFRQLSGKAVNSLERGPDGDIWAGTLNEGIFILDRSYRIKATFNNRNSIITDNSIHHIKQDVTGRRMIVSTINGAYIHLFTNGQWIRMSEKEPEDRNSVLCGNYVLNANVNRNGDLIFSTNRGYTVLDKRLFLRSRVYSDNDSCRFIKKSIITGTTEDPDGKIWIATLSNGIYINKDNAFENLTTRNGLSSNVTYGITTDNEDRIWVATSSGIDIIDQRSKRIRHLSEQNGLPSADFSFGCLRQGEDGILFINSSIGLLTVRTKDIKLSGKALRPFITSVKIDHEKVAILPRYILDKAGRSISFEFSAPCFLNPDKVSYQYRIRQIQNRWIDLGAENRNVTFSNLPNGELNFELRCAEDMEGIGEAEIVSTLIKVPLPLWKNPYVIAIGMLLAILLSALAVRRSTRKSMEKRLRESEINEMLYKERERISRDLHDNLGAYAACIKNNIVEMESTTDGRPVLRNLRENTDELLNSLRETIWALQHESIRITSISDRFKKIVNRICSGYHSIQVEIREEIKKDIFLSPTEGVNLIRIMQEAMTNAVKHAGCTHITVNIESAERLTVRIADNGAGFLHDAVKDDAYGIRNMHARAAEAGFEMGIESSSEGTIILIEKIFRS